MKATVVFSYLYAIAGIQMNAIYKELFLLYLFKMVLTSNFWGNYEILNKTEYWVEARDYEGPSY